MEAVTLGETRNLAPLEAMFTAAKGTLLVTAWAISTAGQIEAAEPNKAYGAHAGSGEVVCLMAEPSYQPTAEEIASNRRIVDAYNQRSGRDAAYFAARKAKRNHAS